MELLLPITIILSGQTLAVEKIFERKVLFIATKNLARSIDPFDADVVVCGIQLLS